ncbi:MAG: hypothetical protein JXB03_11025 [Spirochaetales bacterium]|nr:hypothetical protein [Spirochaetales bacterium]
MNTIPITSKPLQIPYTVIGGKKQDKIQRYPEKFTLLILNRQGRIYRQDLFQNLEKTGFGEILSLESSSASFDLEHLTRKFPKVRFLQFHEDRKQPDKTATIGEKINVGLEEANGRFVCVIWNDLSFKRDMVPAAVFEEIQSRPFLCRVPSLEDTRGEPIPSLLGPAFYKHSLKIVPLETGTAPAPSIYPFDYCGFYDKEKFLLSGGFDGNIKNPYWQILDFGFRNFMWGEQILSMPALKLTYSQEPPSFDSSRDSDYLRFFLKNLAVRFHGDCGKLSKWKFIPFYLKSGLHFSKALKQFNEVRQWVDLNTFRFSQDAVSVTDLWDLA